MRNLATRNAISVVLLAVAVAGIAVQIRAVRQGIVLPQTRLVIVGYVCVALYAAASIAVRVGAARRKR